MTRTIRTYSKLSQLPTVLQRYRYLRLDGKVGEETFGFDRWLKQKFYKDSAWLEARDFVIVRDLGCDLGIEGREIPEGVRILVHHMNPITKEDIVRRSEFLLDPASLVCTIMYTHDAIHYGDENLLYVGPIERKRNDTCPWKK